MKRKSRNRGNHLRRLRFEHEITQLDLALKIGIPRDRYWHIENGYTKPTPSEVEKLAKALSVSEIDLGFPAVAHQAGASS